MRQNNKKEKIVIVYSDRYASPEFVELNSYDQVKSTIKNLGLTEGEFLIFRGENIKNLTHNPYFSHSKNPKESNVL